MAKPAQSVPPRMTTRYALTPAHVTSCALVFGALRSTTTQDDADALMQA